MEAWPVSSQAEGCWPGSRKLLKVDDGSSVEVHAVEEQPAVQRLSVLLLPVGVEGSGERATAAEETY